jgi:hypothetical protein
MLFAILSEMQIQIIIKYYTVEPFKQINLRNEPFSNEVS